MKRSCGISSDDLRGRRNLFLYNKGVILAGIFLTTCGSVVVTAVLYSINMFVCLSREWLILIHLFVLHKNPMQKRHRTKDVDSKEFWDRLEANQEHEKRMRMLRMEMEASEVRFA
jgi:hypothetical protein